MSALRRRREAVRTGTVAAHATRDPSANVATRLQGWRLILRVFLPCAAAYFLAYLFRSINALISSDLSAELSLEAADLGFLTSVYFLAFAALQLPIGIWLDRYGPRRVVGALMPFAVAGAVLFSMSRGFATLTLARALIGLGVAAAFTGGLKAIGQWFPRDRVSTMNGCLLMVGAVGALSATSPAKLLLDASGGWRGLFMILAAATAVCALTIWIVVPEQASAQRSSRGQAPASLKTIYGDPRFWRVAPLSAMNAGTTWALQSLWAAPWLTDVDGLARADVTRCLFVMAIAACCTAVPIGMAVDRLRRQGIGAQAPLAVVAAMVVAAQLALILRWPAPPLLSWSVIAAAGTAPVLSYAILADCFPKEIAGRANGALNLFHFGGAFAVQCLIGVIVGLWPNHDGHYPASAYQAALGFNLCLYVAALSWFVFSWGINEGMAPATALRSLAVTKRRSAAPDPLSAARRQTRLWRLASLGSASLAALLSLALGISVVGANVAPAAVATARRNESPAFLRDVVSAPPDAQIAFVLAEFVKDIRTVSTDPVVVRSNWSDALEYLTARGARMLDAYARDEHPFAKIGKGSVIVTVTRAMRVAHDTFEIRWDESTIENNTAVKRNSFVAAISIVCRAPAVSEIASKNPLGLYIDWFTWRRDSMTSGT